MDKVDSTVTQEIWPPDSVLSMIGMTREEWNRMAEIIERKHIPWDWLIESAAKKIARRRQGELVQLQQEARRLDDLARVKREA